ncbi:MAG TPA: ABC transporter substrate-binding protein [Thermoanaerobaculia bacterium]
MRKPPRGALACFLILVGAACASAASSSRHPDLLQAHLDSEPKTLDPILTTDASGYVVESLLFTPLVAFDHNLSPGPGLARTWTISTDSKTYDFELDPRATFDDGSPVTAQDVRFTIERIRDPKVPAVARKSDFEDLVSVEAVSDRVLRVRFRRTYSERLLAFDLPVLPEHVFRLGESAAREYGRRPVGNGPYRFVRWDPGQSIVVERRRDSAGAGAGIPRAVFRILPDPSTWTNAGVRGELDEFRIPLAMVPGLERKPAFSSRFRTLQVPRLAQTAIVWSCRHPFLGEASVRRALGMAIPTAQIVENLYRGKARLVSGPYPAGVVENAPDVLPLSYDLRHAATLLENAGWRRDSSGRLSKEGRRSSFALLIPAGANASLQIAQILESEYAKLGVPMTIQALDWPALSARLEAGDFDACLSETVFYPPNLDPYVAFHSSQTPPNGQNTGFYRSPAADRLMEAARTEGNRERRLELYREIHRRLAEDQPNAFLFTADSVWAIHRGLRGVETSPLGLWLFQPGARAWKWGR